MIVDIPRIVHQIWLGGDTPQHYDRYQESYRILEKRGWKYSFWCDQKAAAFVGNSYPQYESLWASIAQPIKRAELLRYLLMHSFGGLYADLDSRLTGDVEEFLAAHEIVREDFTGELWPIEPRMNIFAAFDIALGAEPTIWDHPYNCHGLGMRKINNAVLFSRPACSFWLELIKFAEARVERPVLNAFGVHTFTYFVYRAILDAWPKVTSPPASRGDAPRILVLPPQYFYQAAESDDPRQLIVHEYHGNWRSP